MSGAVLLRERIAQARVNVKNQQSAQSRKRGNEDGTVTAEK
jgi:hypothetical protein